MKFALIDGKKTEASKGAKGFCRVCDSELIAKCGESRVNHWAHKGNRACDRWWENETDWHRSWKGRFPTEWQEVVHSDQNGEKHIADVKTEYGWVLEFQHSFLNPEERRAREAFYIKLVWVVDGLRRKKDVSQFQKAITEGEVVNNNPLILRIRFPDECRLLKEWLECSAPVFFDFQDPNEHAALWVLFPKTNGNAYLSRFSRSEFIKYHHDKRFDELVSNTILPIREILASRHASRPLNHSNSLSGFERHLANKRRRHRRF